MSDLEAEASDPGLTAEGKLAQAKSLLCTVIGLLDSVPFRPEYAARVQEALDSLDRCELPNDNTNDLNSRA